MEYSSRLIHFYELNLPHKDGHNQEQTLRDVITNIIELNKNKSKERLLNGIDQYTCTRDVIFRTDSKIIQGKILRVRMDIFPELLNTVNDIIRNIETSENDGIVEVTHFLIDYSKSLNIIVALEFNQYGAKINDFKWYINHFLKKFGIDGESVVNTIIRDNLDTFARRINRCSSLTAKVHKDNVHRVNEISNDLFSAFDHALKVGESEYAEIFIKFDYRKKNETPTITQNAISWVKKILADKKTAEIFDELTVQAEDADKNYKLELFDLISNRVKSVINVQKRPKTRSLISSDIFEKLVQEVIKQKL